MNDLKAMGAYGRALRPWRERFVAVLLVSPACTISGWFWAEREPALLTVASLLLDRMLLPTTVLLAVSIAIFLVGPWPLARTVSLLAGGLSIAVGLSACLAIRPPIDYAGALLAFLALIGGLGLVLLRCRAAMRSWELRIPQAALIATGLLALLPVIQFWHVSSFVPSRLNTTVGASVKVTAKPTAGGAHGTIAVKVTNGGDVGALIVASELIVCYRTKPGETKTQADLYDDPSCVTEQIFDNLTELDSRSTWDVQRILRPSREKRQARIVEATVLLWYARQDRLKTESDVVLSIFEPGVTNCSSQNGDVLSAYAVLDDSRAQAVVQAPRRLVYLRRGGQGDAYFAFQARGETVCDPETSLPQASAYHLDESVGLKQLRLNFETWVTGI